MNDKRSTQMIWLLALTALSLVPVYILLGWQSGGHSPNEITDWLKWFWRIEASAWGLRALVESAALIYLFQTITSDQLSNKILVGFEVSLISLIALTVGLVIVSNGSGLSIASGLPNWLYWVWSFGVAAFAPLMMGSVGFAYKVHAPVANPQPIVDSTQKDIAKLQGQLEAITQRLEADHNPVVTRRNAIREALNGPNPPTHKVLAELYGVSVGTIGNDVKSLNGSVNGKPHQ